MNDLDRTVIVPWYDESGSRRTDERPPIFHIKQLPPGPKREEQPDCPDWLLAAVHADVKRICSE